MKFLKFSQPTSAILKSILFCLVFIALLVAFSTLKSFISVKYERLAHGIIGTVVALLSTYLFIRFDKKSFSDIGLKFEKSTLKKFFAGILIGIVLMGLPAICVIYFSGFKIEVNENSSTLNFLFLTLPLILLSFMEEVAFRGYPLTILKEKTGIRISILITSILFALYHLANGWTIANSFLGAGVWGIVFGLSAIYSNGISMPTGLHYAANLTTSAFGITSNSFNIWVLKQQDGGSLENFHTSQLTTLIPQICLLILGIVCMELFIRSNKLSGMKASH